MNTAIKIFIAFGSVCLATVYLLAGPFLLVNSIQDTVLYLSERNNTTQIEATVTSIDHTADVDGGTEYDIHVSYQINNILYKNIYWKSVSTQSEYSVGDFVNVSVFNSKPNDIVVDFGFFDYIGWIFPLIITLIPIWVLIMYIPQIKKKSKHSLKKLFALSVGKNK